MTQESAPRPCLELAPSEETTRSQHLGQTWSQHQTKERPNGHCFHSSKYQLSPQRVQQVAYKGLLNPSSNWLRNPNCLITKIILHLPHQHYYKKKNFFSKKLSAYIGLCLKPKIEIQLQFFQQHTKHLECNFGYDKIQVAKDKFVN